MASSMREEICAWKDINGGKKHVSLLLLAIIQGSMEREEHESF